MLSARTASRQIPAAPKNSKPANDGAELRELRLLLGMSLEEACRRYPHVDVPRLSRYERGLSRCIAEEHRAGLEKVFLAEINLRVGKMAEVIAKADRT